MRLRRKKTILTLYHCPRHGFIESPGFYGPPYAETPEEEHHYCPINLSSNEHGITDDVCNARVDGPHTFYL